MKKSDFYYYLPEELIAQTPIEPRDASRLMVLNAQNGEVVHKHFKDIIEYIDGLEQEKYLLDFEVGQWKKTC